MPPISWITSSKIFCATFHCPGCKFRELKLGKATLFHSAPLGFLVHAFKITVSRLSVLLNMFGPVWALSLHI